MNPVIEEEKPKKNWFRRLLSGNVRETDRKRVDQLHAYYWEGGPSAPHNIRDISLSGVYLLTEENWYPGTVVTLTLRKADSKDGDPDSSITVLGKVVRSGPDGAGLRIILAKPQAGRQPSRNFISTADKKAFQRFLRRIGITNKKRHKTQTAAEAKENEEEAHETTHKTR